MFEPTSTQQIFLQQSALGNHCAYSFFDREYPAADIERAVNKIIETNDALRMRPNGDKIELLDYEYTPIPQVGFSSKEEMDAFFREEMKKDLFTNRYLFDLFIVKVYGRTGVVCVIHHFLGDGFSFAVFSRRLAEFLRGEELPECSFIPHMLSESEYRSSAGYKRDTAFWNATLSPMPETACFDAGAERTAVNESVFLPPGLAVRLAELCKKREISEASVLYAALAVMLERVSGFGRFTVGTPVIGRVSKADHETMGLYMHIVPLVMEVSDIPFAELAENITGRLLSLYRHYRFTSYDIQKNCLGGALTYKELFDVTAEYSLPVGADGVETYELFGDRLTVDLEFHFNRFSEDSFKITLRRKERLASLLDAFVFLLEQCIEAPDELVSGFALSKASSSSGDELSVPDGGLYSLIERQSAGRIVDGGREYGMDELRRDSEKIDAAVRGEKRVIGLICDRSYQQLAAIYGIVRGGNAYLPISPDYPAERIRLMLSQSGCDTVLAQKKYAAMAEGALVIEDILNAPAPAVIPPAAACADDTLYVIFTSGSTGTPKGAMISNRSAVNRVLWMCRKYFDHDSVVMLKTPYTFDVSVWEIFGFALGGFTLYILPPEAHYRQDKVIAHIRKGGVTDLHFVPAVYRYFLDALKKDGRPLPSLKNVFLSGEALSAALVNSSPAPVHNLYGPTECAVDVTYYDCKGEETDPVPIGRPVDNCRVYVLDKHMRPLPEGVTGQICVAGAQVGQGYVNDAQRTSESFVADPFGEGRMYLTGDLGYWREDGQLIYTGRSDQQVKINGQRIELAEIEAALISLVPSAAVTAQDNRLIACYTGEERLDLREKLSKTLPRHMIPNTFVNIEKIPLTPSGKVDRIALKRLDSGKSPEYREPVTEEEKALVLAVEKVLSIRRVGADDNFYELGGNSLSAISVTAELNELGYYLTVTDFMKSATLAEAAEKISSSEDIQPDTPADQRAAEEKTSKGTGSCALEYLDGQSGDIEDIYELTPTQLGMYNNWNAYCLRYILRLGEHVDADRLSMSIYCAAKRHPVLKSEIKKLDNGSVVQLIHKTCPKLFYRSDGDIQTFFDCTGNVSEERLFRAALVDNHLVIDTHHIIGDGWSMAVLVRDIKKYYDEPSAVIGPTASFGLYSEWLKHRPSCISYWQSLLNGCEVSSDFPHHGSSVGLPHKTVNKIIEISAVNEYASKHRVTENTVLEAAFSLLLFQYNSSAVYGKVVSGRNAPIEDIKDIVGVFINTIPVYIKGTSDIVSQIHEQSVAANLNGFTPLSEIYSYTDLRRINILFVFENYPMETEIEFVSRVEQTEFDLTFTVRKTGTGYCVSASYATEKYSSDTIRDVLDRYEKTIINLLDDKTEIKRGKNASAVYEAPVNDTEAEICGLFGSVIGAERVGRNDNYYDLGGTSLGMMELLSSAPLEKLSASEFMTHPTPAALAGLLKKTESASLIAPLYIPDGASSAIVLFSYGGGDAAAYTALTAEFRKRNAPAALFYCPWTDDYGAAEKELRRLAEDYTLTFYSHCAGAVTAMKLIDRLNAGGRTVERYIAGADVPPAQPRNIWRLVSDKMLLAVLHKAGMPELTDEQNKELLRSFRKNTGEYFSYFMGKTSRTDITVALVLSRRDIFTAEHRKAAKLWERYVEKVAGVEYLDSPTHYFQSSNAAELADIILRKET